MDTETSQTIEAPCCNQQGIFSSKENDIVFYLLTLQQAAGNSQASDD